MPHFALRTQKIDLFTIRAASSAVEAIETIVSQFVPGATLSNGSMSLYGQRHCADFSAYEVTPIEPVRGRMGRVIGFRAVEAV